MSSHTSNKEMCVSPLTLDFNELPDCLPCLLYSMIPTNKQRFPCYQFWILRFRCTQPGFITSRVGQEFDPKWSALTPPSPRLLMDSMFPLEQGIDVVHCEHRSVSPRRRALRFSDYDSSIAASRWGDSQRCYSLSFRESIHTTSLRSQR